MAGRPRFFTGLVAVSVAMAWSAACGGTSPSAPGPGPTSPAVVSLSIRGLPEPLLVDVPPSLKAGQRIPLTVVATLADGSSTTARPSALAWSSKDASIASFEGDTLVAHREGVVDIRVATPDGQTSTEMTVSVRSNVPVVIEARSGDFPCTGVKNACPYGWCPSTGPYWVFPVYEDGTVELMGVDNPGWGSPSNYIVRLSKTGERLDFGQLLLMGNHQYRTAPVKGGFMYGFYMQANLGPCGRASATWSRPN